MTLRRRSENFLAELRAPVSHCDAAEKNSESSTEATEWRKICEGFLKATEIFPLNRDKFRRHDISPSVSTVTT